jgi:hypothetical protein
MPCKALYAHAAFLPVLAASIYLYRAGVPAWQQQPWTLRAYLTPRGNVVRCISKTFDLQRTQISTALAVRFDPGFQPNSLLVTFSPHFLSHGAHASTVTGTSDYERCIQ